MSARPRTRGARLAAAGSVALLAGLVWLGAPGLVGPNFHEVLPGRVYRSGQLSVAELENAIRTHRLRTIVNLRGTKPGLEWYDGEARTAERHGLAFYDLDFSARRLPPRPTVIALIDALAEGPEPILLHCAAGSDRAGLASGVAKIVRAGAGLEEARGELSLAFGHLPFGTSTELDRFFDLYAEDLAARPRADSPAAFSDWVRLRYVPYGYSARLELIEAPAGGPPSSPARVRIRVTNTSRESWRLTTSTRRGVKLGIQIRHDDEPTWREFDRTLYEDRTIEAGGSVDLVHEFALPSKPGRHWLKFDMVDEHVTWFEQQGSTPAIVMVEVSS